MAERYLLGNQFILLERIPSIVSRNPDEYRGVVGREEAGAKGGQIKQQVFLRAFYFSTVAGMQ